MANKISRPKGKRRKKRGIFKPAPNGILREADLTVKELREYRIACAVGSG